MPPPRSTSLQFVNGWLVPAHAFRALALGVLVGAIAAPYLPISLALYSGALLACLVLAWRFPRHSASWLALTGVCLLLLRSAFVPTSPANLLPLGPAEFTARVVAAPRTTDRSARYVVEPRGLSPLVVVAKPIPSYAFGDELHVKCKNVAQTEQPELSGGVERTCTFPEMYRTAQASPSFRGSLLTLRRVLGNRVRALLPEPPASLVTGMLWGDDEGLPRSLVLAFRRTGTSHILAVSGYNVMLLVTLCFSLLVGLGLWRPTASVGVLAMVAAFVAFTGAEPAVVRAGIMGSLVVLGRTFGRRPDRLNILLAAAAAMLLFQPGVVSGLSFQLSFAAMGGLLFLAPIVEPRLSFLPAAWSLREAASQTVAATLVTAPVVLVRLGSFSVVTPIANLLVAPVVPLVYVLSLPLLVPFPGSSVLVPPIALLLIVLLSLFVWVVGSLASLPWAAAAQPVAAWVVALAVYALVAWWLWPSRAKRGKATSQIT